MSQAVIQLGQLFAATLVPATQKEAEKSLEGAAVQPGFLRGLFEVRCDNPCAPQSGAPP